MTHYKPGSMGEQIYYAKMAREGTACPVCERLYGGDKAGLKKHMQSHTKRERKAGWYWVRSALKAAQRTKRGRKLLENA